MPADDYNAPYLLAKTRVIGLKTIKPRFYLVGIVVPKYGKLLEPWSRGH